jgi:transglutaminase-like putative cysteine protease
MRIAVQYRTHYRYSAPVRSIIQLLRLTPADHAGQHVLDWRIDPSRDGILHPFTDAFGNCAHVFYCDGPVDDLALDVTGLVLTEDASGIVRGAPEPLPPPFFRRTTPLTCPDARIRALARDATAGLGDPLERLHALMRAIHGAMTFDATATEVSTGAHEAMELGRGVCQDFAHVFCAAARDLGVPARYVSGHLARSERQPAKHAWAEAHVEGLGWVGFDASACLSPTAAYVRVATGLDYRDAAPVRGARQGGGEETLSVEVAANHTGSQ